MSGRELLELLQAMTPEQLELPVNLMDANHEVAGYLTSVDAMDAAEIEDRDLGEHLDPCVLLGYDN